MNFKKVGLVFKPNFKQLPNCKELSEHILKLVRYLLSRNIKVYLSSNDNLNIEDLQNVTLEIQVGDIENFIEELDLVIVIGGDGTFLSVARKVVSSNIPIIGVNQGRLGFMTDIAMEDMLSSIEEIIFGGKFTLEMRTLLKGEVIRDNQCVFSGLSLNDTVISRGSTGSMIEFNLTIDGQFVLSQKSDGIIFATPTGSTAYSLAAGGPILQPESHVFSIVPICPQSLSNRPLVVSDEVKIELLLINDNETYIHFDGQECFKLNLHDTVLLSKHTQALRLIHPSRYNYYRTLRKKLEWSKRVS
jgi:NAD+ kinase